MKKGLFIFLLISLTYKCYSQEIKLEDLIPVKTALKINLNGFKIGVEQKIYKKLTGQFEIGMLPSKGKSITLKPQLRVYRKIFNKNYSYLGLAYLYKQQKVNYNDSVSQVNDEGHFIGTPYKKDFTVTKYIQAITLNTGFLSEERIFKQRFIFEFNIGVGIRYKKSRRYGLLSNEEVFLPVDAQIRQSLYYDTEGKFKIYPELNLNLSLIIPLKK